MINNKASDKFARIMAVISILIAIAAVVVVYIQGESSQSQQQEQFEILQKEELSSQLNPHIDGLVQLTDIDLGQFGHVIQIPWELTISNTGDRQLSITDYSISTGDYPESMSYTGIDGGIVSKDAIPIDLPLTIEAGESLRLYVFVGILVSNSVFDIVSTLDHEYDSIMTQFLIQELAKQEVDLYGNHVEYQEFGGGGYLFSVIEENPTSPTFWCRIVTGRGNTFMASANQYESPLE